MYHRLSKTPMPVLVIPVFAMALGLLAGCGDDSSQPTPAPELSVMGAIQMNQSAPAGGPYYVGVVVAVDGKPITDATVTVDGVPLAYHNDPANPDQVGYVGQIPFAEGQVAELRVNCSAGERTFQAVGPGFAQIAAPTMGKRYQDGQDVEVAWTPAANAVLCIVTCNGPTTATPGMWVLSGSSGTQAVPASFTTPPGNRISVFSLNGQGDLPSLDLRTWVGKNGFWATSEAWADVQVEP